MNIRLRMSPHIWHENHDFINTKLIVFFTIMLSVFMVSMIWGNKTFIAPQLNFSKSLSPHIFKGGLDTNQENFTFQQNTGFTHRQIINFSDFGMPQLIEKLNDSTPLHQRLTVCCLSSNGVEAANHLSKFGSTAIEPLITALSDPRATVRGNAALALGMIKNDAATKPIIALLEDKNPIVRMKTAMALAAKDNDQVTAALIGALSDEEAGVRTQVVRALAGREDYKVKKALIASLKDQNWLVRSEIKAALQ